jgi:polyprenyl-phospho-N-acetylgalactosaminyl synthase
MDEDNVWIVIAAFNEERMIGSVVGGLGAVYRNVVVVDDGSSDRTVAVAAAAGAITLRHPINLGQGAALQTGMVYALARGADFIVTFDADGQHRVEDIARLLGALSGAGADVACGSRFLGTAVAMPLSRRLALRMAALFTSMTVGIKVTDAHNGLRAFTSDAVRKIEIKQNRMAHASEIIWQIKAKHLRLIEVPVTILYSEYSLAKGQRLSNSLNILLDLLGGRFLK